MKQLSINRISLIGFAVLIAGSTVSGTVLMALLFKLEGVRIEKQVTENAYDSVFELKYHTERLLTNHDLDEEIEHIQQSSAQTETALNALFVHRSDLKPRLNETWKVVLAEIDRIETQLKNPLFQARNTMEKSLLRRLGEGLNANEQSDYYISLTELSNAIDFLKQYEVFLLDELHELRIQHNAEAESEMANTMFLAILLPILILAITITFALVTFRMLSKVERKLLSTQKHLRQSLDQMNTQRDELDHLAHHDALTQLPNRMLLLDRLDHSIKKAKRHNTSMSLLYIDLDGFKEVNDSLGHSVGDGLITTIAERLVHQLREEDTIARLGGDEFVVLLEEADALQSANFIAQKILLAIQEPTEVGEHNLYMTASIGISVYPNDGDNAEDLLRNADSAMYKAKDDGRNTFRFYTADMTQRALERVTMMAQMRHGLKNNEFTLHYQPQVDLQSGKIVGLEALLRWNSSERGGPVSPANFIPLAEESGFILPLGEWVLHTACTQLASWHNKGLNPGRLAVNLSVKQLSQPNLFRRVQQTLEQTGCDPNWIELEVTEGFIMNKPEESIAILNQFNFLGIELSIDDFGTGYSSFSYLKRLPIHKLKIDRSFIDGLPNDGDDAAITRAVIALAKEMRLGVLAEGVETEQQAEFLTNEGCSHAQGYLFARPMPADEVESLLEQERYPQVS
jgi:diguanylate cyclase (GGDEF)-like protein